MAQCHLGVALEGRHNMSLSLHPAQVVSATWSIFNERRLMAQKLCTVCFFQTHSFLSCTPFRKEVKVVSPSQTPSPHRLPFLTLLAPNQRLAA